MIEQFFRTYSIVAPSSRHKLFILLILLLINSLFELIGVAFVIQLIRLIENPASVLTTPYLKLIYDWFAFTEPRHFLIATSVAFLGVFLAKNVFFLLFSNYQARFIFFEAAAVSKRFYELYLHSPYAMHLKRNSADLITMTDSTVDRVFSIVLVSYVMLATEFCVIAGILSILVITEPLISLGVGATLGTCFVLMFLSLKNRMTAYGAANLRYLSLSLQSLQQGLGSVKELKVMGREKYFIDAFEEVRQGFARVQWLSTVLSNLPRMVVETLIVGGIVAVITAILLQERQTGEIITVLGLFAVAAFRMMPSMNRMMMALNNIKQGKSGVDLLYDDLQLLKPPSAVLESSADFAFVREIVIDDLSYSYPETDKKVLNGLSFTIKRGESIGIVGPSGAGKSTLVDIMLGLLPPTAGHVLVDGHDIIIEPRPWRHLIGYVPQSVALTDDKLKRNVAFGVPKTEIDDDRVWHALRLAQLEDFARQLPDGLETMLGEDGVRLSGGQRQRIGIARALYHDPAVLFMDEATSSLDGETEREINLAIESLRGEKTLVVIAHRLSTVRRCDRLILLKDGKLVDNGGFEELFARCEEFRHMVKLAEMVALAPEDLSALAQSN